MHTLAILGSTGSIGAQTLDVVRAHPDRLAVDALIGGKNVEVLESQVREFRPRVAAMADERAARELRSRVGSITDVYGGADGVREAIAESNATTLVSAFVGFAGLLPTIDAVRRGLRVAIANKEILVAAGAAVIAEARAHGATILPIDSEHSAIWQCLAGESMDTIARIVLTASGGPFHGLPAEAIASVRPADALRHPTWRMGEKITIDSATLMNKGLEVIEAHWLFGLAPELIEVVIHPQSIIHSLVEFVDGSVKAQLGCPDMRLPIQYAIMHPDRLPLPAERLDLVRLGSLSFFAPDVDRFPCLGLARAALESGGTFPAALNAANEVAVHAFLGGAIRFPDIPVVISRVLGAHAGGAEASLDAVLDADRRARECATALVPSFAASARPTVLK
jgi:1-deoxy-D-xylulose-5-phosphate reductoisomerase